MNEDRPNPDALLAEVAAEERKAARGKLKIFFGSNAGVGKTFAMLDEARKRAAEGAKLLVGYAEPHIRPDTEALLLGLDILPYKLVEHKGATLKEFDLDAALAKHPTLICVDELAHSNAPGMRHPKRWQDVEELLNAGINVYATLNVQHLESVNDIVERITGVKVRETLPDRVLDEADEVELVDIAPDELIERLREGKVYKPQQAEQALKHFFNRGNLIALRELALRKTAERVDAQMREARRTNATTQTPPPWAASERILVCVGPSPFAAQLVRATKRLAMGVRAPWVAAFVETPSSVNMTEAARARLTENMQLAEQLGAETVTLSGNNVADELIAYSRQKNITKIVAGKPELPRWREWLFGSIVEELIRRSGSIDVYVIRHEGEKNRPARVAQQPEKVGWQPYAYALGICTLATLLGMFVYHVLGNHGKRFSNTNTLMIELLAVLFVATRFGRWPAIVASLYAVAAFDFTVVPPYYTFSVEDSQYVFTFAVMLATALLISTMADRIRRQAVAARNRERRTAALLSLSRDLTAKRERTEIVEAEVRHVSGVFDSIAAVFLPNAKGELAMAGMSRETQPLDEKELSVIQWVFDHGQAAGRGTDTLPSATGIYLPMSAMRGIVGVLGLLDSKEPQSPERVHLLEAFANQSAVAIERAALAEESRQAWERVEAEFLRNTLLSGVSHDLRTPLATITGAASSLVESNGIAEDARKELAQSIVCESERMERLITNLLDMTRLEAGGFPLKLDWYALQDIVGTAIQSTRKKLGDRNVKTHFPQDLPLIRVDGMAMEQVLINLLDNAASYTPPGTEIVISASVNAEELELQVTDGGPGLPPADPGQVFQKFFRGAASNGNAQSDNGSRHGAGLGLAICKGIIGLHGGTIRAENRAEGGARFCIRIPTGGRPPAVPIETDAENTL
ncbi:MAG TPA: sensor histidine kinase KdpD [Phycisphaerae bacterium]|nr:sensor histidine kinase KdpD [Phycisphaerae bacterium]